ncbi:MAG: DedA family protein [Phycisphaerae bacterium]|nr:DedA family protein [Phycisphaerae bacterium]
MEGLLVSVLGKWSYLGLFVILMAAGMGMPLPEDIPLVAAGWLVHRGQADLGLMIATGLLGVMLGDSILYFMGRRYGLQIVEHRWFRRIAKPWLVERARRMYADHGAKIIFAARFMPGLRAVLFLTAGVFRVRYWKFASIDGFAALISVPTWIWLSSRFSRLLSEMRVGTYVIGGVLLAALCLWILWEYFHNLRKRNGTRRKGSANGVVHSAPIVTPAEPTPGGSAERRRQGASPSQVESVGPVKIR